MANKRTLKKNINIICEDLFAECIAAIHYGDNNQDNGEALLFSIVRLQNNFTARISHPEPGMEPRIYFKDLREQFSAQVSELLDQINN